MQKIIIDTNVIVSALISKGIPFHIVNDLLFERHAEIYTSDPIIQEYFDVLSREKFSKFPSFKYNASIVINLIEELGIKFNPTQKLDILKDTDDNKFLELALFAKADFIITGNTRDFTLEKIGNTLIVTPSEYWETHRQK